MGDRIGGGEGRAVSCLTLLQSEGWGLLGYLDGKKGAMKDLEIVGLNLFFL